MGWKQPIPTGLEADFGEDYFCNLLYRELIYRAANKDGYFTNKKGKTAEIKRGQVVFGRRQFAKYLDCDDSKVERNLQKLCKIYKKVSLKVSRSNYTIVNLLNYDELVRFEPQDEPIVSQSRAASEPIVSTSKSVKSEENEKSVTTTLAISPQNKEIWDYWEEQIAPITRNQIFQRNALIRLSKAHGNDRLQKMIRLAAAAHVEKFSPSTVKCNSPADLEKKWDALTIWGKAKFTKQETSNTITI